MAPIRTTRLFSASGNLASLVQSVDIPVGHVWIVKDWHVRNGTASNTVLINGGIRVGGVYYTIVSYSGMLAGSTGHEGGDFVVAVAGDAIWFQSNNSGTCQGFASGCDLS